MLAAISEAIMLLIINKCLKKHTQGRLILASFKNLRQNIFKFCAFLVSISNISYTTYL